MIESALRPFQKLALRAGMAATRELELKPLLRAALRPDLAQKKVLRAIIDASHDTSFGVKHAFRNIQSISEWRQAVPVHSFEDLRPWIERQAETGEPCLTRASPVFYNLTSGTTAKPKLVPLTRASIRRIRRWQRISAGALDQADPLLFSGRLVGIGSSANEGRLPNGVRYGSVTGLIYREMPASVRARYVLPAEIFDIADHETRYRIIATFLAAAEDVTFASTANPSTFIRLLALLNEQLDPILSDVASGKISVGRDLDAAARDEVQRRMRPRPDRARELVCAAKVSGRLAWSDLWPRLRGIATWTGGSCRFALEGLRPHLASDTPVFEAGYAASEFRGSINVDPTRNLCLPTLADVFFEFVESDSWERGERHFLGLEEIEQGRNYRVFATTADGLYRYDINDIVSVEGRIGATPVIMFVQKSRGVTSITGEKLYESQMNDAVAAVCAKAGLRPTFYLALAGETGYRVHLEIEGGHYDSAMLARGLDEAIALRNIEYRAKRASGRLGAVTIVPLRAGAALAYRRHCVAAGQRDAQFKVLPLRYAREVDFDFTPWRLG
jgi:hypothetical protein